MKGTIVERPIFNYNGSDAYQDKKIFGGNPTGIANVNEVRYPFADDFYQTYQNNVWFPEQVSVVNDKNDFSRITSHELKALEETLSFLTFMDSYQCMQLPNIGRYITDPSIENCLVMQTVQEVIHTKSYQYILNNLFSYMDREHIYYAWRDSPMLLKHINFIADVAKSFNLDPTNPIEMVKMLAITYALESVFFYHGFAFFYHLSYRKLFVNTSEIIEYIENDELSHVRLFANIILHTFEDKDYIILRDMMERSVDQEIERSKYLYGNDRLLGITHGTIEQYIQLLADNSCKLVGINPIYGVNDNPYGFITKSKRKDFFSTKVLAYDRGDSFQGWDELKTHQMRYF